MTFTSTSTLRSSHFQNSWDDDSWIIYKSQQSRLYETVLPPSPQNQSPPHMRASAVSKANMTFSMETEKRTQSAYGAAAFSRLLLYKHFFSWLECNFLHQHSVLYYSKTMITSKHGDLKTTNLNAYGVAFLPSFRHTKLPPKRQPRRLYAPPNLRYYKNRWWYPMETKDRCTMEVCCACARSNSTQL